MTWRPKSTSFWLATACFQDLAFEQVDAHRREVAGAAAGQLGEQPGQPIGRRLLVEVHDAPAVVHLEDAERGRLIRGDGNDGDRRVGAAAPVRLEHRRVVHAVKLIARQDHHVAGRRAPHVVQALADGVGRALEPVAAFLGLFGGEHADEPRREHVELVGHRDVPVQALGVELRQHEDLPQARVQAVADRDVDQPVLAADRHSRLRPFQGEGEQARTTSAPENDRQHVVHLHRPRSISEVRQVRSGRLVFAQRTYGAATPSARGEPGSWRDREMQDHGRARQKLPRVPFITQTQLRIGSTQRGVAELDVRRLPPAPAHPARLIIQTTVTCRLAQVVVEIERRPVHQSPILQQGLRRKAGGARPRQAQNEQPPPASPVPIGSTSCAT